MRKTLQAEQPARGNGLARSSDRGITTAMRRLLTAALVALVLGPSAARAQSYAIYGADRYFPIDAQTEARSRGAVVAGYVRNEGGLAARDLRLRVEQLDAGGQVVATSVGYVFGTLTPGRRVYFEVPVPSAAATYRVSVLSFHWINPVGT